MKKLLGILILFLVMTTITAQTSGIHNRFQAKPEIERDFNSLQNRLSFEADGWFYMFSYINDNTSYAEIMWGSDEKKERDLWLMRTKDGENWSKAISKPIRTDWMTRLSHDWYYPLTDKGASVFQDHSRITMIILTCHRNEDTSQSGADKRYELVIKIKSIGDGMFDVIAKGQLR
jgi:hypothetical protein